MEGRRTVLFNSIQFLIFFPVVVAAYFALPFRFRWAFLLAASYYFYMCWRPEYVILIVASTAVDYVAGLQMGKAAHQSQRKKWLLLSIATNLGLLFAFKYFNFFNASARAVFESFDLFYGVPAFDVLLPVGISFYTFQSLSYTFDVYRGVKEPERHFGIFAVYVAFFPQLVAGPIERAPRLLPQFRQEHRFDLDRVKAGLGLMLWGFFKKIVIADRLAIYVEAAYSNPASTDGLTLIMATYFFAFQIYCDFSGYSDIAIGAARVMGIQLMNNFDRPYGAQSIAIFWRRWHISLTTWFREYVYLPLGGNRVSTARWVRNILVVFLVSGLWHGANWTFVIWGGLHGAYLLFERATEPLRRRLTEGLGLTRIPAVHGWIKIVITFHLVCFAWIFFRADTIDDALLIASSLGQGSWTWAAFAGPFNQAELTVALLAVAFMIIVEDGVKNRDLAGVMARRPAALRWAFYYAVILAIAVFGVFDQQEFIYFQF
jgi:D-alanyl-lipoteichoic acid acyltransferase DltB (MBOAT superfamily)